MDSLDKLPEKHKQKLQWFLSNRNKEVSWKETRPENNRIPDSPFLFTTAKGIFKPKDSEYALSIKVMLNSHYQDQKIIPHNDGSWSFRYHQEENDGKSANALATNKGLVACMRDGIPIGVAIQKNGKPGARYNILGLAQVVELRDGFFQINGYSNDGKVTTGQSYGPYTEELDKIEVEMFDPETQLDARYKVLKQIVQRQGQKKFREELLRIYNSTCVITKCNVPSVLEAAHITPYLGLNTNKISNGLILRADIHTLWDLGLIAIDPSEMTIHISSVLNGSEYEHFNLIKIIELDVNENERLSKKALQVQWDLFSKK